MFTSFCNIKRATLLDKKCTRMCFALINSHAAERRETRIILRQDWFLTGFLPNCSVAYFKLDLWRQKKGTLLRVTSTVGCPRVPPGLQQSDLPSTITDFCVFMWLTSSPTSEYEKDTHRINLTPLCKQSRGTFNLKTHEPSRKDGMVAYVHTFC